MRGSRRAVPNSIDEFVKDWDDFLVACILKRSPRGVDTDRVTDLRSEVILLVIERDIIGKFKGRSSFGTYLWAVVTRLLSDIFEKEAHFPGQREELSDEVIMEHLAGANELHQSQQLAVEARMLRDKVRRRIEARPRLVRTFDMLLAGYRQREIAAVTGWPESTVYSYVRRLRQAGRSTFEEGQACTR